ncbi:hypothetical protein LCGC14_0572130 [marine sediment metagenome]|uniref:Uncharacterized protein n=1 Tax=marine sediment metagenome TaxID=412755 RepID=A0A0F9RIY5_9ZZZZ
MADELRNLEALVDTVAKRIATEVKAGDVKALKELLWHVPVVILKQYAVGGH